MEQQRAQQDDAAAGEKTAPAEAGAEYRAEKPQNVELPTVPIINLSMQDVANMNGGILPEKGNYLRKTVIDRAEQRMGLGENEAVYIEASNVKRNGEDYVLRISKGTLDKAFAGKSYSDGVVPIENVAVIENLERIVNNGVWYDSRPDRNKRSQIAGYDYLRTVVYIDNKPYEVNMRVRVYDEKAGGGNRLYHFTPEEIEVVKIEEGTSPTGTLRERAIQKTGEAPASNTTVPQGVPGVKKQSMQNGPAVFADSSLTQRMAEAETEYNTAIEQAEAGGEYQLAEALYTEKLRLQDALTEQEIGRLRNELEQYQRQHQAGAQGSGLKGIGLQFFAISPDVNAKKVANFKADLKNGNVNLVIRKQKQNEHIEGTTERNTRTNRDSANGKVSTYFYKGTDVEKLISSLCGTGTIQFGSENSIYPIEFITLEKPVGKAYNCGTRMWVDVSKIAIRYSKNGIHAHPVKDW